MNIWTGPRCLEQNISQFDEERAFKPEALKKRNFSEKTSLGLSMRRNNNRPLPTLATLNPNSIFGGITPQKRRLKKNINEGEAILIVTSQSQQYIQHGVIKPLQKQLERYRT